MKKLIFAGLLISLSFASNAQVNFSNPKNLPSKQEALRQILALHPNAVEESTVSQDLKGQEDMSKKHCDSIGWYEASTGCWGISTSCTHSILFGLITWETYSEQYVGCP